MVYTRQRIMLDLCIEWGGKERREFYHFVRAGEFGAKFVRWSKLNRTNPRGAAWAAHAGQTVRKTLRF